jgi:hypothetical protein
MGAPPTLERLNHRHDAIILWLLTYPDRTLGDCAEYFGYTQAWLSRIIHTDMFQAAYKQKAQELCAAPIHELKSKMIFLAATALDKATERIEGGLASERFLSDTMKASLTSLGYGAPVVQNDNRSQQVHVHVSAEQLAEARERAATIRTGTTQAKIVEEFIDAAPKGPVQ